MKKLLLLSAMLIGLHAAEVKAQSSKPVEKEQKKSMAEKGTYQLEFLSEKQDPVAITFELREEIENHRDQNRITYIQKNGYRIKVLPYATINAPGFKPVADYVIVERF
jgi:hypothetical protein